jgi:TolB protein
MAEGNRSFFWCLLWVTAGAASLYGSPSARAGTDLGIFDAETDVGTVAPPGSAQFDKASQQYTLKSSGQNIWAKHDDFHFVYRKISGDFVATAEVSFVGADTHPHRKAGWMIRQGLEPDAAYVDVMVHGEGLIAMQYRLKQGDITETVKSPVSQPAIVRLERHGDAFELYAAAKPDAKDESPKFQLVGSVKLGLTDPAFIGLAVSAHDPKAVETAVVSGVSLKAEAPAAAAPKP